MFKKNLMTIFTNLYIKLLAYRDRSVNVFPMKPVHASKKGSEDFRTTSKP